MASQKLRSTDQGLSEEDQNFMKNYNRRAIPYFISGIVFNIIFISLVLSHTLDLSGKNTKAVDLMDIQSRIGYVLKYSTPGLLWLVFCIAYVTTVRVRTPAVDPLNNSEDMVLKAKNILVNSFEQFILSLCSQLVLVTHLGSEQTMRYIPALSFLFVLGRITFALGYPGKRDFGFFTNMAPLLLTVFYICYKFFGLYF